MINRLRVQSASVVVPIGLLHMGSARHRALLYKALSGDLGMQCRIVKGRRPDGEPPAVAACPNLLQALACVNLGGTVALAANRLCAMLAVPQHTTSPTACHLF